MAVLKKERLILSDFADEKDGINVLEKPPPEENRQAFDKDEFKFPPIEAVEDMRQSTFVKPIMDNQDHLPVYNFFGGEEEEVAEDDDVLEYPAHSTPTARRSLFSKTGMTMALPRRDHRDKRNEVKNKMENIGVHLSNAVLEKKKRMESYIKGVVKDCDKHIKQHWKVHQDEVREFKIEFTEQIITLFQQWDSDMKKVGDLEESLSSTFCRQQKTFQQTRLRQTHSLKALKQANAKFLKDIENLEKDKSNVLSSVHNEFKKQIVFLQRKITDG